MSYKHVCISCRKAFSQGHNDFTKIIDNRPCPECKATMIFVSQKFKPPKKTDVKAWAVVSYLLENGFAFYTAYDKQGKYIPYPKTLEEAIEFVREQNEKKLRSLPRST